jgi:hypothetical protein
MGTNPSRGGGGEKATLSEFSVEHGCTAPHVVLVGGESLDESGGRLPQQEFEATGKDGSEGV